jgi:hypothetical protein
MFRAGGPLTPDPSPRFTGARGGLVVGVRCSVGEPRTGVRGCSVSVARAFQPEFCASAIDLSPQGRVSCRQPGSREAAKPRRETHEGCCGVW